MTNFHFHNEQEGVWDWQFKIDSQIKQATFNFSTPDDKKYLKKRRGHTPRI